MRVYLIRHAQPEDEDEDEDDPGLTKEGREQAKAVAAWMVDKEEIPTILLASPKTRTQETAQIIADTIGEAGFAAPEVKTDVGIGPHMSVKGTIEQMGADKSMVRVGIVSHHESLEHGLRVLGRAPFVHLDIFAMAELRIVKVSRKDGSWDEHRRVSPSDLGGYDRY